jgi:hypothetical protein
MSIDNHKPTGRKYNENLKTQNRANRIPIQPIKKEPLVKIKADLVSGYSALPSAGIP